MHRCPAHDAVYAGTAILNLEQLLIGRLLLRLGKTFDGRQTELPRRDCGQLASLLRRLREPVTILLERVAWQPGHTPPCPSIEGLPVHYRPADPRLGEPADRSEIRRFAGF